MKRRRGFGKRIAAGLLAVLMTVGMMPVDLSGILARSSVLALAGDDAEGGISLQTEGTTEYEKRFILTGTVESTSALYTTGSNRASNATVTGGYIYNSTEKTGEVEVYNEDNAGEYSFIFYSGESKAGFNSGINTSFESQSYTGRFNTQGAMSYRKASLETTLGTDDSVEKYKIEVIWQASGYDSGKDTATRLAGIKKVENGSLSSDYLTYSNIVKKTNDGNDEEVTIATDGSKTSMNDNVYKTTYEHVEAGTYQIGSTSNGIYIYEIRIYTESPDDDDNKDTSDGYAVNVKYAGDYQLSGAGEGELTYTFTKAKVEGEDSDTVITKTPGELSSLKLDKGSYTLSISGTALDKIPYELSSESSSFTVTGSNDEITLALTRITKWSFGSDNFDMTLQSSSDTKTAYYKGLLLDATSGKIGKNNATYAQFQTDAKITVPVQGKGTVKITSYKGQFKVNDIEATGVTYEYPYDTNVNEVVIVSTGSDEYISTIEVQTEEVTYPVTLSYADDYQLASAGDDALTYVFTKGTGDDAKVTKVTKGNLTDNTVNLEAGTYTISLEGDAIDSIPYELAEGSKSVTVTSNGGSVTLALTRVSTWNFGTTDGYCNVKLTTGAKKYYKGLVLDATSGSFSTFNTNNTQFFAGAKISVPVDGASKITVKTEGEGHLTVDGTANTSENGYSNKVYTYTYEGDGTSVDIVATADDYIYYITVEKIQVDTTPTYAVAVTLEGDILNSAADNALTYTFALNDGTEDDTKTFNTTQIKAGIKLKAGTYTLSLSGDAIDKPSSDYKAYELAEASKTVTVGTNEAENKCTVSLTQVTKWLFGNKTGFKGLYQSKKDKVTGYYKGLYIDASNGKLNTLNDNGTENASRDTNAQFNSGTILSVPVAGACKIKVTMNSTYAYTINGFAVNQAEYTYVYPGNAGMVNIVSTAGDYIISIEILGDAVETVSASGTVSLANSQTLPSDLKLVFTNTADADQVYYADVNSDGTYALNLPSTTDGATFDVTLNTTAYAISTGSSVTAKTGVNIEQDITIRENVARNITVKTSGDEQPDLTKEGVQIVFTDVDSKNDYRFKSTDAITLYDGTYRVTIEGENYHTQGFKLVNDSLNLTVSADTTFTLKFEKAASWKFNATESSEDDYYAATINTGSSGYYNGLHVVTSSLHTHYENGKGGKLSARLTSGDTQANSDTVIYVPVTGAGTVTVNVKSGGKYGQYVTIGEGETAVTGTADSTSVSYKYTGTEATTIPVTILDGETEDGTKKVISVYLQSISVTYAGDDTANTAQSMMPSVDDGNLKASAKDAISVNAVGQKLNITQTGGNYTTPSNVSYYVFPATTDKMILEFDVVVTASDDKKSEFGFYGGLFTAQNQYTIAMRSGSTVLRALKDYGSASGTTYAITMGTKVHYSITTDGTKAYITATFVDADGVSQVDEFSQGLEDSSAQYYYGFAVTSSSATVTNMVYKSADGKTVYYNQNNAYNPKGTAPKATKISAVTRTGTLKSDTINVSWEGDDAEYDGYYELQVKIDNGGWTTVATDLTTKSYTYKVGAATTHSYAFQIYGVLGKGDNGGTKSTAVSVTMKDRITGALATPVVTATAGTSNITLTWDKDSNATEYWVYRYSFDEGATNAKQVATVKTNTYTDTKVDAEMPYYYYVSSKSSDNSSDFSETVWAMITTTEAHTGTYVYEDDATEIFITKKSYDTVFNGTATLQGNVYGVGTLEVSGGSGKAQTATISKSGDSFAFDIPLNQGRNDVNLIFTDSKGNKTRKTYNFVYLTNYNKLVDPDFSGNNGEANTDGVATYKTIQAAVNSVSENNTERVVILVKEGSYNERLVVDRPNVTIIGQDRENTLVHYAPGSVGGDMAARCAIYVKEAAKGFSAENISFANDYVYGSLNQSNQSADALRVDATESSFVNVKISGVQDTLYMDKGYQYYYKCRIEGLIDYIYSGDNARAFFDDCELVFLYNSNKTSGYVCAPKSSADATYGLTFYNCVVTAEEGCNGTGYLLARPWGENAYITWINCYIGKAINATLPYSDMSGNSYKKARFYEYGSYGPGFAVNSDRRQISATKANSMISDLGWSPSSAVSVIGGKYVGSIKTTALGDETQTEVREVNTYEQTDGDDTGLARYSQEGFASVYSSKGVTGGGLQKVDTADYDNPNYYEVKTATEFLEALTSVKQSGKASVINLTADVNLGCYEIGDALTKYSDVIKAYLNQAITHPTLMTTGVSVLTISNMYNLTIMSSNGSAIKHANITMKNSGNIIIRNIVFDELWEWDEYTTGDYDRNDWDYMTLDTGTNGVWIDHCTFYKAYDGVVDIKNPDPTENVTISWCEFLPASAGYSLENGGDNTFFGIMMNELKNNADKYPYYKSLLDSGMTHEQIIGYAYGQKKTHLLGQSADATNAVGIRATFANNYYKDSMDRMPRLRYGTAHVYNCVLDAQDLFTIKASITNAEAAKHIVSNGVSSTCDGQILVENSYINGIINALNSGNGSDTSGYIDAVNSLYYINGVRYALEPKVNTTKAGEVVKKTNASAFRTALGYSYNLRDAATLSSTVLPYVGAGTLNLTVLQWEKNTYNDEYVSEGSTGTYTNDGLPSSPYSASTSDSSSGNGGSGNNNSGSVDNSGSGNVSGGGNNGGSGNNSGSVDNSGSDDDYSYDDDDSTSGSGSGSGSTGSSGSVSGGTTTGTTGNTAGTTGTTGTDAGSEADTTPIGDVLTAEDIPGATVTTIDGTEFAEMGAVGTSTSNAMQALDENGNITTNEPVNQTTEDLTQAIAEQIAAGADEFYVFASANADVSADVINSLVDNARTMSIGIIGDNGKCTAILTLDGKVLEKSDKNFDLKITIDPQSSSARTKAASLGIGMNSYTVINFDFSGELPGTFKVAVDVSDKFADGTQLALYYNNEQAGRLENQYQVTNVKNGFAEFAIDHCSEYVLVDVSAARNVITTNTLRAPKTGDNNHLVLWVTMMGIVAAAYFGYSAYAADRKKARR